MRIAALLVAAAFVSACHSAQPARVASAPAPNPAVQSDRDGLTTMRMVLSAQASRAKGTPFNSLSDVLKGLPTLQSRSSAIDTETAAINGGYRLRLTLSEDRQHFQASLTPEKGCGTSWFGSDQNLIYVGHPLGCPTN